MSIEQIPLRKLLRLIYAPAGKRRSLLRDDIRADLNKEDEQDADGGDFFGPFWADAKKHVTGECDLHTKTVERIQKNKRRKRLYGLLENGFLKWWDEKRRWKNEPFILIPQKVKSQLVISEVSGLVKIENLLALNVGNSSNRIIYPYFSEIPPLPEQGQRIALTILHKGLPSWKLENLRILDVLRSTSSGTLDNKLIGNEYELFVQHYAQLLKEWKKLRTEYD